MVSVDVLKSTARRLLQWPHSRRAWRQNWRILLRRWLTTNGRDAAVHSCHCWWCL